MRRGWLRIMRPDGRPSGRKPYKTQKYHEIDRNPLKIDRLRGNLIGVLSGSKTRKRVYAETI